MGEQLADAIEDGVYGSIARGFGLFDLAVNVQLQARLLRSFRPGDDAQGHELNALMLAQDLIIHQGDDILVEHVLSSGPRRL